MDKKKLFLGFSIILMAFVTVTTVISSQGFLDLKAGETTSWRHYSGLSATSDGPGIKEYWTNCKGVTQLTNPGTTAVDYTSTRESVNAIVSTYGLSDSRIVKYPSEETIVAANSVANVKSILGICGNESVTYSVTDRTGSQVTLVNDEFTVSGIGHYYKARATFTQGGISYTNETAIVVEGTMFDSFKSTAINTWVSNNWNQKTTCEREVVTNTDGSKAFKFVVNKNYYKVTFNIPGTIAGKSIENGKNYHVQFRCWTNALSDDKILVLQRDTNSFVYNVVGSNSATNNDNIFSFDFTSDGGRIRTFYIASTATTDTAFFIDDLLVYEAGAFVAEGTNASTYTDIEGNQIVASQKFGGFYIYPNNHNLFAAGDQVNISFKYRTVMKATQRALRIANYVSEKKGTSYSATLLADSSWTTITTTATMFTSETAEVSTTALTGNARPHIKASWVAATGATGDSLLYLKDIVITKA